MQRVERPKLAEGDSEAGVPTITLEGGEYLLGYLDSVIPGRRGGAVLVFSHVLFYVGSPAHYLSVYLSTSLPSLGDKDCKQAGWAGSEREGRYLVAMETHDGVYVVW